MSATQAQTVSACTGYGSSNAMLMSTGVEASVLRRPPTRVGPVTRARIVRTLTIYAAAVAVGALPLVLGWDAKWQAAGIGLWCPGAGFLAAGSWWGLLMPVGLILFALAVFFWFGAAMVLAPPLVWAGLAGLSALVTGDHIWPPAPLLTALLVSGLLGWSYLRHRRRMQLGPQVFARMAAALPQELAAAQARAVPVPPPSERELTREQLAALRYALDRALQPIEQWNGFDVIDEFQTAARRYQINFLGYALALAQHDYLPSFHGYLSAAQRALIQRYQRPEVWRYWIYETAWGHLNFRNFDPAGKDNIMLTGFLAQQVGLYMSATGDRRYAAPGSIVFEGVGKLRYEHNLQTIAASISWNLDHSAFCLYPCEPHWIYPICNHYGLVAVALTDRLFGTGRFARVYPRWIESLHRELTDSSGNVVGLRSAFTGFEFKFPNGSAGYASMAAAFAPERAWEQWAQARITLQKALVRDKEGVLRLKLPGSGFDAGNYRPGHGQAYAGIATIAREFGDEEIAQAALRALDLDYGRSEEGGVLSYRNMSNSANASHVSARLRRRGTFRDAITHGPSPAALTGPLLEEAEYPAVLVAHALSSGDDLRLVLYPGLMEGPRSLGFARLRPGAPYRLAGTGNEPATILADAAGRARCAAVLAGRTELHLVPAVH